MSGTIGSQAGRRMLRVGWVAIWAGALLGPLGAGCDATAEGVVREREEFQQSRREAELKAQIATLDARLEDERVKLVQEQNRADRIQKELTIERNARRQEKLQLDLAIDRYSETAKKLDESRKQFQADEAEIKRLRTDVIKWRELLDQRDEELARLREQVGELQKKLDALDRQAQR